MIDKEKIVYYAVMELSTSTGGKTPKYTITKEMGYYEPMLSLKGRDGKISMYLKEKLKEGEYIPSVSLQAKNSLNFTGLKEWYLYNGRLSGHAYGYPLNKETYSKDKKPNPFFKYANDGFLFVIHQENEQLTPSCIELIVLSGGKHVVPLYCRQLANGGFDDILKGYREFFSNGQ